MWLAVARPDLERAREILAARERSGMSAPEEAGYDAALDRDRDTGACPACGGNVPRDAARCPECDLNFGP